MDEGTYGSSLLGQWDRIVNAVEASPWPHQSILDVGAGQGKAEALLREYLNVKPAVVVACEPNPDYADRLEARYDNLIDADVRELAAAILAGFDTVIMADVIEHMPWADGMALLRRIPGQMIVSTPVEADPHPDDPGTPILERHVCQWDLADFLQTGRLDRHWIWQSGTAHVAQHIVRLRPL